MLEESQKRIYKAGGYGHSTSPYPVGTIVRIKKTGQFARINDVVFLIDGKSFLHYEGEIEGRGPGNYYMHHQDVELECLPEGWIEDKSKN